jgi:hypothetical protein
VGHNARVPDSAAMVFKFSALSAANAIRRAFPGRRGRFCERVGIEPARGSVVLGNFSQKVGQALLAETSAQIRASDRRQGQLIGAAGGIRDQVRFGP